MKMSDDAPLTVRPAQPDDLPSLVEFNRAMAWETEALVLDLARLSAGVRAVLDDPANGHYLVAERAGAAVGSLMVTFEWSDWRNARFWWIQSVYVAPDARRQGVYRALYAATRDAARDAGACGLRLYAEVHNTRAHETYRALGMRDGHYGVFEESLA
jgi:GNAT superfamily N-acetyltransferase